MRIEPIQHRIGEDDGDGAVHRRHHLAAEMGAHALKPEAGMGDQLHPFEERTVATGPQGDAAHQRGHILVSEKQILALHGHAEGMAHRATAGAGREGE